MTTLSIILLVFCGVLLGDIIALFAYIALFERRVLRACRPPRPSKTRA